MPEQYQFNQLNDEAQTVLGENRQGTIEHDTAVSLRMTVAAYRGVLAALDMTYDQRGHTTTTWQQWYADKHAGLIKEN